MTYILLIKCLILFYLLICVWMNYFVTRPRRHRRPPSLEDDDGRRRRVTHPFVGERRAPERRAAPSLSVVLPHDHWDLEDDDTVPLHTVTYLEDDDGRVPAELGAVVLHRLRRGRPPAVTHRSIPLHTTHCQ